MYNILPDRLFESPVFKEVFDTNMLETSRLQDAILDIKKQFFISTATWGLVFWEKQYNIIPEENATIEDRRSIIKSALLGLSTFTKAQAQALANTFSQLKNAEFAELGNFEILTSYSVEDISDIRAVIEAFRKLKPAHVVHKVGLNTNVNGSEEYDLTTLLQMLIEIHDTGELTMYNNIKIATSIMGAGMYNPLSFDVLYLNGLTKLDGSKNLNGINDLGEKLYSDKTEELIITVTKNGASNITSV